jgi:hypothetical protein
MNPFIAHLVGDFILQNEWMAANKRKSSLVCLLHVLVYVLPFLLTGLVWWQIILIGTTHFLQDRSGFVFWWVRFYKRVPEKHWGIIPLMVDQGFHLLTIEMAILLGNMI